MPAVVVLGTYYASVSVLTYFANMFRIRSVNEGQPVYMVLNSANNTTLVQLMNSAGMFVVNPLEAPLTSLPVNFIANVDDCDPLGEEYIEPKINKFAQDTYGLTLPLTQDMTIDKNRAE